MIRSLRKVNQQKNLVEDTKQLSEIHSEWVWEALVVWALTIRMIFSEVEEWEDSAHFNQVVLEE